jgi:hypothetical protein
VATLLRDGLFDPGGIGLPPSLTIQGGLCTTSGDFNRWRYWNESNINRY